MERVNIEMPLDQVFHDYNTTKEYNSYLIQGKYKAWAGFE